MVTQTIKTIKTRKVHKCLGCDKIYLKKSNAEKCDCVFDQCYDCDIMGHDDEGRAMCESGKTEYCGNPEKDSFDETVASDGMIESSNISLPF